MIDDLILTNPNLEYTRFITAINSKLDLFVLSFTISTSLYTLIFILIRKRSNYSNLTMATTITLVRGYLVVGLLPLVLISYSNYDSIEWLVFTVYGITGVLDIVDGKIARIRNEETKLGDRIDIETDGISTLVGSIIVVILDFAPLSFILVGLARYFYLLLLYILDNLNENYSRSWLSPFLSFVIYISICASLSPVIEPQDSNILLSIVAVPFLINFVRESVWIHLRKNLN